jgi:hypothetical protein
MPIIITDVTAGNSCLVVTDSGWIGINCTPSAALLTVAGNNVVNSSGVYSANMLQAGATAPLSGTLLSVPASGTSTVAINGGTMSCVSLDGVNFNVSNGSSTVTALSSSSMTVRNNTAAARNISYSYW